MPSLLGVHFKSSLLLVALGCLARAALMRDTECFDTFPEQRSRYFLQTLFLYQHYVKKPGSEYDRMMKNTTLMAGVYDRLYSKYQGTKWGTASADKDIEMVATEGLLPPTDDCVDVSQGLTASARGVKTPVVDFKQLKKPGQPISVLKPLAVSAALPRVGWHSRQPHDVRVIVLFTDAAAPSQIAVAPPQPSGSTTVECDGDEPSPQLLAEILKRENIALVPVVQESNAEYWDSTILHDGAGILGHLVICPNGYGEEETAFYVANGISEAILTITCKIESDFSKLSTTFPPTATPKTTTMTSATTVKSSTTSSPTKTPSNASPTTSVPKKAVDTQKSADPQGGTLINAVATTTTTEFPVLSISAPVTVSATSQTRLACGSAIIMTMMLLPLLL